MSACPSPAHHVVCIDFSNSSVQAFNYATHNVVTEVNNDRDELVLVHVLLHGESREAAEARLQDLIKECSHRDIKATAVVLQASGKEDVGKEIVAHALKISASTIIVGARGLNALQKLMLGSVSRYVTEHAHCTVVVPKGINSAEITHQE